MKTFDIPVSIVDLEFVYQPRPGRYTSVAEVSKYTKAYFHKEIYHLSFHRNTKIDSLYDFLRYFMGVDISCFVC